MGFYWLTQNLVLNKVMIMKRYFKDNKKIFKFINSGKYDIKEIRTIRKHYKKGILKNILSHHIVLFMKK